MFVKTIKQFYSIIIFIVVFSIEQILVVPLTGLIYKLLKLTKTKKKNFIFDSILFALMTEIQLKVIEHWEREKKCILHTEFKLFDNIIEVSHTPKLTKL